MSEVPDYVIDTSFLTQPNRDYYAFDICPSFWESLSRLVIERKVETIDKVRKEIMNGSYDDELKKWIRPQPSFFVISTDEQDVIDE